MRARVKGNGLVGSAVIALVFSGEIKGAFHYMSMSSRLLREEKLLSLFVFRASSSFSLRGLR